MQFLKNHKLNIVLILAIIILIFSVCFLRVNINYKLFYTNADFNIEVLKSPVDGNNNGIDDYTDILLGAKIDAQNHPTYDSRYWANGYPPDNIGVCTDVIWRAFKNAGYNLRDMVSNDIKKYNKEIYKIKNPDRNIDFRRVPRLEKFFNKNATILTNDIYDIASWQAGDIVVFNHGHIGIISDKRNRKGIPYVIHNSGQPEREEDILEKRSAKDPITGHFRWDVSELDESILVYFEN